MKVPASILVVAYLIGAFATFGWNYNSVDPSFDRFGYRQFGSVMAGVFWPIYWGGTLAIRWVHP